MTMYFSTASVKNLPKVWTVATSDSDNNSSDDSSDDDSSNFWVLKRQESPPRKRQKKSFIGDLVEVTTTTSSHPTPTTASASSINSIDSPIDPCINSPIENLPENCISGSSTSSNSRNLSPLDRRQILEYLLNYRKREDDHDHKLLYGTFASASRRFGCSQQTVGRIWQRYISTCGPDGLGGDISSQMEKTGRHRKEFDVLERIRTIPIEKRGTLRDLSAATGISVSTLYRRVKEGKLI